jgi:transposase
MVLIFKAACSGRKIKSTILVNPAYSYTDALMFIRRCIKIDKVTGKKYFFYQLVESIRTDRGPRQTTLLNLGADLPITADETKLLADRIEQISSGIHTLFLPTEHIETLAQRFARELIKKRSEVFQSPTTPDPTETDFQTVDVNSLKNEQARTVGVETIAYASFQELGIDQQLSELGFSQRQIETAAAVIIGRLAEPGNELATYEWLQNKSGLDEVMETNFQNLSLRKVYEIGDLLLSKKESIEESLEVQEKDLFNLQDTILLYDLTNTYFEGSAEKHRGAHRGKSKEKRSDCPLITLGVVLNQEGFIKRSRIFAGNVSEPSTLREVLQSLEDSTHKPILVVDAGLATEDNLKKLREAKRPYIAVSRKKAHLNSEELDEIIQEKGENIVRAKLVKCDETEEVELHCHSNNRQEKEQSIQTSFQKHFEQKLQKIADSLKKRGGTKKYETIHLRVGRLCEKYRVISSYYEITIHADETRSQSISLEWRFKEKKAQDRFSGCYVLRAYGINLLPSELWKTYVMLTQVEDAFRAMKTDLKLRPVFHRKENRIDAHLFITVLAYHVMHHIRYKLRQCGLHFSWETMRKNMSSQIRVTTSLKTQEGRQLHVRATTEPEPFHKKIFQALKINSWLKPRKTLI